MPFTMFRLLRTVRVAVPLFIVGVFVFVSPSGSSAQVNYLGEEQGSHTSPRVERRFVTTPGVRHGAKRGLGDVFGRLYGSPEKEDKAFPASAGNLSGLRTQFREEGAEMRARFREQRAGAREGFHERRLELRSQIKEERKRFLEQRHELRQEIKQERKEMKNEFKEQRASLSERYRGVGVAGQHRARLPRLDSRFQKAREELLEKQRMPASTPASPVGTVEEEEPASVAPSDGTGGAEVSPEEGSTAFHSTIIRLRRTGGRGEVRGRVVSPRLRR